MTKWAYVNITYSLSQLSSNYLLYSSCCKVWGDFVLLFVYLEVPYSPVHVFNIFALVLCASHHQCKGYSNKYNAQDSDKFGGKFRVLCVQG